MPSSDAATCSYTGLLSLYLCDLSGGPEHAVEIRVAEHAVGVEAVAHRYESIPERVARPQGRRGLEVELAPVWAALVGVHDRLHLAKVGLVLEPVVHVDGDVAGVARIRGAQRDVVGRHRADLDREADEEALALDHRADVPDGRD